MDGSTPALPILGFAGNQKVTETFPGTWLTRHASGSKGASRTSRTYSGGLTPPRTDAA